MCRRYPVAVHPRSIPAPALLALAALVPASTGCVTPEVAQPPPVAPPSGPVLVLTREGNVRFGEGRWDLQIPTQAARLTVLLTRLTEGAEDPTLVFRGESGTSFAQVKLLMDFLALAEIEDYRVDMGTARAR